MAATSPADNSPEVMNSLLGELRATVGRVEGKDRQHRLHERTAIPVRHRDALRSSRTAGREQQIRVRVR